MPFFPKSVTGRNQTDCWYKMATGLHPEILLVQSIVHFNYSAKCVRISVATDSDRQWNGLKKCTAHTN